MSSLDEQKASPEMLTLLHGTSSLHLSSIKSEGMTDPNLTNSRDLAEQFAEWEVAKVGGDPVILAIRVATSLLKFDNAIMGEPVAYDGKSVSEIENAAAECRAREREETFRLSLEVGGSCEYSGTVRPDQIAIFR